MCDNLIKFYFDLGLEQEDILHYLKKENVNISLRTLQRRLAELELYRRRNFSSQQSVHQFIQNELSFSSLHGFRWMHRKLLLNGFTVTRKAVEDCMRDLDPEGIQLRKAHRLNRRMYRSLGPNYLIHIDGYDKLKRFGVAISGCIDGFSRFLLWLKADYTNNDPSVIAGFFINMVSQIQAVPLTVRSDLGGENTHIRNIQTDLRCRFMQSNRPPFLTGRSTANQRIESWWSILRRQNSTFWMEFFAWLEHEGLFNGTEIDQDLIRFFFMHHVQNDLDQVVNVWNLHNIRRTRNAFSPGGKPCNMYHLGPEMYGCEDYKIQVPPEDIQMWKTTCSFPTLPCRNETLYRLIAGIVTQRNMTYPASTLQDAVNNYVSVRNEVYSVLVV